MGRQPWPRPLPMPVPELVPKSELRLLPMQVPECVPTLVPKRLPELVPKRLPKPVLMRLPRLVPMPLTKLLPKLVPKPFPRLVPKPGPLLVLLLSLLQRRMQNSRNQATGTPAAIARPRRSRRPTACGSRLTALGLTRLTRDTTVVPRSLSSGPAAAKSPAAAF